MVPTPDDDLEARHVASLELARTRYETAERELEGHRLSMAHAAAEASKDGMSLARIGKWLNRSPEGVRRLIALLDE